MGLTDGSSRLWPQARVIVLALITFGAVGCMRTQLVSTTIHFEESSKALA
jgi:hypothetical protein